MKKPTSKTKWFVFFIFAACSGCNAILVSVLGPTKLYPGPERPVSELAVLENGANIQIGAVNGVGVPAMSSPVFHIMPGQTKLTVYYSEKYSNAAWKSLAWNTFELTFLAQAGHTYKVFGDSLVMGTNLCVGVRDEQLSKVVVATGIPCSNL
jgi:hypothetical protein